MKKEISGLFLFFLSSFLLLGILTYSSKDPSINNSVSFKDVHNLTGIVGAYICGSLIDLLGIGIIAVPVFFLVKSYCVFKEYTGFLEDIFAFVSFFIFIIFTGILFADFNSYFHFPKYPVVTGFLRDFLFLYLNRPGAYIVIVFVFIVSFMIATGATLSFFYFSLRLIKEKTTALLNAVFKIFLFLKSLFKRKKDKENIKVSEKNSEKSSEPKVVKKKKPDSPAQKKINSKKAGFPFSFLSIPENKLDSAEFKEEIQKSSRILVDKLIDFGITGEIVSVSRGPVVTTFEYKPAPGIKISKIANLADDLALALKALGIRIVAPIPGKSVIGIEVPNKIRSSVYSREIFETESFVNSNSPLTIGLGKDIEGTPVVVTLEKMPHLLIAGATGAGKSVCLNMMIASFLFKASPEEVKMIMVDPKRIELSVYQDIPHLISPVVTDMKKAKNVLFWAVAEMERRYELLEEYKCRNISQYNSKVASGKEDSPIEKLPYIVVIIDELADLMMVASKEIEFALIRLAQMARACGIHLIIATQRPSVDVLTGIIKANFPTRIAFKVSSKVDSRTILDSNGAEKLLGKGDMLFLPPGVAGLRRIHGAFISEDELEKVIDYVKSTGSPDYIKDIGEDEVSLSVAPSSMMKSSDGGDGDDDEKYQMAIDIAMKNKKISISMIQRHLKIGFNRAARIVERMDEEGILAPQEGSKPRKVIMK